MGLLYIFNHRGGVIRNINLHIKCLDVRESNVIDGSYEMHKSALLVLIAICSKIFTTFTLIYLNFHPLCLRKTISEAVFLSPISH